jgi:transcriptional regulator of met regulon
MDTALIRAHAAVKRHFKSTQTEVLFLLTARDSERRALNAIHQQLSDLLVERFGPSFYGSPQPEPDTSSVVVLCIIVIVGLAVLYFGFV